MRICICDDDPFTVEHLSDSIRTFLGKTRMKSSSISVFKNGDSLLKDRESKDLVFLDIEMPGINGIQVGQQLTQNNKNVIIFIVTSYMEYLDEAMKFHVFRYLSKPIDEQRLFRNLKDAVELYSNIKAILPIETKGGVLTVPTTQIIYIEAVDHKIIIHTTNADYLTVQNMQYWTDRLPHGSFFQSHRSFIVNFAFVTDFNHNTIHLNNGQYTAYLTRRKYTSFKSAYLLYTETC